MDQVLLVVPGHSVQGDVYGKLKSGFSLRFSTRAALFDPPAIRPPRPSTAQIVSAEYDWRESSQLNSFQTLADRLPPPNRTHQVIASKYRMITWQGLKRLSWEKSPDELPRCPAESFVQKTKPVVHQKETTVGQMTPETFDFLPARHLEFIAARKVEKRMVEQGRIRERQGKGIGCGINARSVSNFPEHRRQGGGVFLPAPSSVLDVRGNKVRQEFFGFGFFRIGRNFR
ncbi:MAG: hypothetical protein V3U53_00250 [bacterium]